MDEFDSGGGFENTSSRLAAQEQIAVVDERSAKALGGAKIMLGDMSPEKLAEGTFFGGDAEGLVDFMVEGFLKLAIDLVDELA